MIQAKFRCMSVTRKWDNTEIAEFRPVNRGKDKDPENQKFWDATPSGEAALVFNGPSGFDPGDYYYVNMTPEADSRWTLCSVTRHQDQSGEAYFRCEWIETSSGLVSAHLKMGVNYPEVVDAFGKPNAKWKLEFVHAEKSDWLPDTYCG
jgi:hypothetical protein